MIGSGLKKLAKEHGMNVDKGIAYGSLGGFAASMSEGSGYKQITFATTLPDPAKRVALQDLVGRQDIRKEYRVQNLGISPKAIQVVFADTVGTMKKIQAFLEWFLPILQDAGATGVNICPECGCEITGGCWKMINGIAYYMHTACADKVCRDIGAAEQTRREEETGNYFTGLLGALLGAAVGAVLWAVIMYAGYIASIAGLAIGWLAERGYTLLKGKNGKGKILILIIAVIFGVLVGNLGADVITIAAMIGDGEMGAMTFTDIPLFLTIMLTEDASYMQATLSNIGMGLLFAALGVWGLLRKAKAEVSGTKVVDLK